MQVNPLRSRTEVALADLRSFGFKNPEKLLRDQFSIQEVPSPFCIYWNMYSFNESFTKKLENFVEQLKHE